MQIPHTRLIRHEELDLIVPFLQSMYSDISESTLRERMQAIGTTNWKCLGVFNESKLLAISGFWINTRIYCGKYLYVDHFTVKQEVRSKGVGQELLNCILEIAREEKCEQVCLDTFTGNSGAQRFWLKHGFKVVGFHFVNSLIL